MTEPIHQLLLLYLVLHGVEGLMLGARHAVVFSGWRRFGATRPGSSGRFGERGLVFLPPWAAGQLAFVVEPNRLWLGPDGVWVGSVADPEVQPEAPRRIDPAEGRVEVEAKRVSWGAASVLLASSAVGAEHAAARLRAWLAAPKKKKRAPDARALDPAAVRARVEQARAATAVLGWLGPSTSLVVLLGLLGLLGAPAVQLMWPWVLGGSLALLILNWGLVFRAHAQLQPGRILDRVTLMAFVMLSPPAASWARAHVVRDALAGFDPVVVASVLLDREALLEFVGPWWRAIRYPGSLPASVEAERVRMEAGWRAALESAGVDPAELERGPDEEGQWCPRCLETYGDGASACEDCGGIPLVGAG